MRHVATFLLAVLMTLLFAGLSQAADQPIDQDTQAVHQAAPDAAISVPVTDARDADTAPARGILLLSVITAIGLGFAQLPTLQIYHPKNRERIVTINETDFDPARHERYDPNAPPDGDPDGDTSEGAGASKAAAALAEANGIDLGAVKGSGKDGAVTKADVGAAIKAKAAGASEGEG